MGIGWSGSSVSHSVGREAAEKGLFADHCHKEYGIFSLRLPRSLSLR